MIQRSYPNNRRSANPHQLGSCDFQEILIERGNMVAKLGSGFAIKERATLPPTDCYLYATYENLVSRNHLLSY